MGRRDTPNPAGGHAPTGMSDRVRWALRLPATIRWGAAAALAGAALASLLLLLHSDAPDDVGGVAEAAILAGALLNCAAVAVVTVAGFALLVVGWRQPSWSRWVLLLVPVALAITVGMLVGAVFTTGSID